MRFNYGMKDFRTIEQGEENCYLLTNGLGGFSSLTMIGSNARNDHALLMGVSHSPNERYHLITNVKEELMINDQCYSLWSQRRVNDTETSEGYQYLQCFSKEYFPEWTYLIDGVRVKKTIVMQQQQNTVGIRYQVEDQQQRSVKLRVTPLFQGVKKGSRFYPKSFEMDAQPKQGNMYVNGWNIELDTKGEVEVYAPQYIEDLYYQQDARDGRDAVGTVFANCQIMYQMQSARENFDLVFRAAYGNERRMGEDGTKQSLSQIITDEMAYQDRLAERSGLHNSYGAELAKSANQYLSYRDSTGEKTILAGFPFFGDWGRDTMIAMMGCTIATGQFEDTKSILRTFADYCREGLMPNIFPEEGDEPLYNTVDAALLFFETVNQYYEATRDLEFVRELYPVMQEILSYYQKGTKYHIIMEDDKLLSAGNGLEQVTWMDVRFGEILPTPRHGKPVEVNAYWFNAWKIMERMSQLLGENELQNMAGKMAEKVKKSFLQKFWMEEEQCLKDVVSGNTYDRQIRCNQVWTLSLSYIMPTRDQGRKILDKIRSELYTPYGLRSLSYKDKEFCANYGGSQFHRDMAYHQGTVWAYPLGAYYLACLRLAENKQQKASEIREELHWMESSMEEGCIGHIAEVFDGGRPTISKGCFAQAWSVGEILRVYKALEDIENS